MMKKLKKTCTLIILIYIILNLVIIPEKCIEAAQNSILLCFNVVVPSLFPFFAVSHIFISLGFASYFSRFLSFFMYPLFGVSGAGALSVVLGMISGYPVGASTSVSLYEGGHITKAEAEKLLAFTNNSGPLFILGALGTGILGSFYSGLILYISHILSALIVGVIFKFYKSCDSSVTNTLPPSSKHIKVRTISQSLGDAINSSVENMLKVCAFIVLFSVICSFIPESPVSSFIYSLFEITGGLNLMSKLPIDETLKMSLISFFLSFSGLSVMCQVSSIVTPAGLSIKPYIFGKLSQGILSFYLTELLFLHFPPTKSASTLLDPIYKDILPQSMWQASLTLLMFFGILITFILFIGYIAKNNKK